MKVYISGPMRGYDDFNYPLFHEVEQALFKSGLPVADDGLVIGSILEVCNPANNFNGDQSRPISDYLDLALKQVGEADALVLLPYWEQSEGANLEVSEAFRLGKKFYAAQRVGALWHFNEVDAKPKAQYETVDGGERTTYPSGMLREPSSGKTRFDLVFPANQPYERQMFVRIAELFTRGATKYEARNWETANTLRERDYFRESAIRHFFQWYLAADDIEDHAAAIFFNVMAAEYTKERISDALIS